MRAAVVLAAAMVSIPGCTPSGGEPEDASGDDPSLDAGANAFADAGCMPMVEMSPPTYAPTYDAVWTEILLHTCATEFCHGGSADFLQLYGEQNGYQSLLGRTQGPDCASTGLLRVDPYHPETSLMYLKITSPPCGNKMPISYGCYLDAKQIEQIRQWIACGALDGDAGCVEAGADAGATDADAATGEASADALSD